MLASSSAEDNLYHKKTCCHIRNLFWKWQFFCSLSGGTARHSKLTIFYKTFFIALRYNKTKLKNNDGEGRRMEEAIRQVCYDETLQISAYYFRRLQKGFVNHFHGYYVFGLIEAGSTVMSCRQQEYQLERGHLFVFNPGDNHGCLQCGSEPLEYRTVNIDSAVMLRLAAEITGSAELPVFSCPVLKNEEIARHLRTLHEMILQQAAEFAKEEALLFLLSQLIQHYSQPFDYSIPDCRIEVEQACRFLQQHYAQTIGLEQVCQVVGLSKSTLLRAFTKSKGVTPYRYLQAVRVDAAQKLLQQGWTPLEAALQTGFSDQSHFTNYFQQMIGLTPGAYREMFTKKQGRE